MTPVSAGKLSTCGCRLERGRCSATRARRRPHGTVLQYYLDLPNVSCVRDSWPAPFGELNTHDPVEALPPDAGR